MNILNNYKFYWPWENNTTASSLTLDELEYINKNRIKPLITKDGFNYHIIFGKHILNITHPPQIVILYLMGHDEYSTEYVIKKYGAAIYDNRFDNPKYVEWRNYILENNICICGETATHAHHIRNQADNPELRYDKSNGIALCNNCHKEFHHIYGYRNTNEIQLKEFTDERCIRAES